MEWSVCISKLPGTRVCLINAANARLTSAAAGNTYAGTAGNLCANPSSKGYVRLNEGSDEANGLVAGAVFQSAEVTGNGASQNTAHGLGVVPSLCWAVFTNISGGAATITIGAHDATNAKFTVTNGEKYRVYAIA